MRFRDTALAAALHARRPLALTLIAVAWVLTCGPAAAQAPRNFTPSDETPEDFPAGAGREETFYLCTACHNFKLVAAQGLNRRQWDESFQLMINKHGMANIEGDDRKLVLDYLEKTYPPGDASRSGGWQNPFLKK